MVKYDIDLLAKALFKEDEDLAKRHPILLIFGVIALSVGIANKFCNILRSKIDNKNQ